MVKFNFTYGSDITIEQRIGFEMAAAISFFTALDLSQHTLESGDSENPDGSVSSIGTGDATYFSIDGGDTK